MTDNLDVYNAQLQVKHREVWNSPWIVDHAIIWMQNLDLSINEKLLIAINYINCCIVFRNTIRWLSKI